MLSVMDLTCSEEDLERGPNIATTPLAEQILGLDLIINIRLIPRRLQVFSSAVKVSSGGILTVSGNSSMSGRMSLEIIHIILFKCSEPILLLLPSTQRIFKDKKCHHVFSLETYDLQFVKKHNTVSTEWTFGHLI